MIDKVQTGTCTQTCEPHFSVENGHKPNIRVISFNPEHMRLLNPLPGVTRFPEDSCELLSILPLSFTLLDNRDRVVTCCGVFALPDNPRLGMTWLISSTLFKNNGIAITRLIHQFFDRLSVENRFDVVQADVVKDSPVAKKWIKFFGFTKAVRILENVDYNIYERVI